MFTTYIVYIVYGLMVHKNEEVRTTFGLRLKNEETRRGGEGREREEGGRE